MSALERLRREHDSLTFPREPIERLALDEGQLLQLLVAAPQPVRAEPAAGRLDAGAALEQKIQRTKDRIYRLLTLIYPWRDIAAAQWTIAHGDSRSRASASEYLDNILQGALRKQMMPVLEEMPIEEKVRAATCS